jgi:nucleoside-diphosphate-sugar epimerase
MRIVADADHAARLTGWRARVSLNDGLRRTIEAMVKGSWGPP